MNLFEIELSSKARKDLNRLSNDDCRAVAGALQKLSLSPFPKKKIIKKIKGTRHPIYRMRVDTRSDSFRVFYIIASSSTVVVLRVVSKKEADRAIKILK
jgi:mRNA-degrading endonuclease RelE of RelBE toxin-antitoxin system